MTITDRRTQESPPSRTGARSRSGISQAAADARPVPSRADEVDQRNELAMIYLSNGLTMTGVSMLVRYADFVSFLGGGESQLGLVVGVGMLGSLAMRLAMGIGIDRYGSRRIWLGSLLLFVVSVVSHEFITTAYGPGIFLARLLMQTSIAGIFGASITNVSRRVPPARVAEMVGTVGISGFIGMLLGPQIADWICGHGDVGQAELSRLFQASGIAAGLGWLAAWWATRREVPPRARRRAPILAVMSRYQPGLILVVAVAAGAGLNLPFTFLRAFALERGLASIGIFFSVYSVVAILVRLLTRNLFERFGNRPWVIVGLALLTVSLVCYLVVRRPWHWIVPGALAGVAHALLFPAIVAAGSTVFPARYRGLGTTLMLAMFDVGNLVGSPFVGLTLDAARWCGLAAYPTMILVVTAVLAAISIAYAAIGERLAPSRSQDPLGRLTRRQTSDCSPVVGNTESNDRGPAEDRPPARNRDNVEPP